MEKHQEELYFLIRQQGSTLTKEILCKKLWCIFRNPGQPIPYYYFDNSGVGIYNNLQEEIPMIWELDETGKLYMESDGSGISFECLHYREIFLGFFLKEQNSSILLFDALGAKDQAMAYFN